jgi:hypothetical protein
MYCRSKCLSITSIGTNVNMRLHHDCLTKKKSFFRIILKKLGIICNLNKEHSPLKREPIHKKTTYMSTERIKMSKRGGELGFSKN